MPADPSSPAEGEPHHPIDLRRMQVFTSSARNLSFAACAQQLGLTPSAVSHAIRSLEEELNCILFQRHGPRVTLSRAGIRLLPIAEGLLQQVERIRSEVSMFEEESRHLRVIAPEFICAGVLPRVLPDFQECFPSFRLEIVVREDAEGSINSVQRREADLYLGLKSVPEADVVRRDLLEGRLGLYVAPFHSLARSQRVDSRELSRHTLLVPHAGILGILESSRVIESLANQRAWVLASVESVREFARMGTGIAVLGESTAGPAIGSGTLEPLLFSGALPSLTCAAYWAGNVQPSWAAEAFLSFLEMIDGI